MTDHEFNTIEEWRECPGFPDYSVSSAGRVRRDTPSTRGGPGRILAASFTRGYAYVTLYVDRERRCRSVHRLVARAFLGESPEGKPWVNHINSVRSDNRPENLEWNSPQDDADHKVRMGRSSRGESHAAALRRVVPRGDAHFLRLHPEAIRHGDALTQSKLTNKAVRKAFHRRIDGATFREIAHDSGVSESSIWRALRGKCWRRTLTPTETALLDGIDLRKKPRRKDTE